MKRIFISLFTLLLIGLAVESNAQNEKFKALFMYNFTKYIEWPSGMESGEFVIGILGSSPMKKELDIISSKKKVSDQPIKVKVYNSINDIGGCHILFIPTEKSASLESAQAQTKGKGTLIITDKPGLGRKGAGINYIISGGRQDFEINIKTFEEQRLKVNAALYSLGKVVN
ncbi:MAG: YfiR family protein [Salinivirgaceae bacterium]|jgi:hypothetical protein|nr:YfiR family protein [Salinivirgaceae bacterium]